MNCKGMIKYLPVVLLLCACTENELLLKEHEAFAVRFSASGIATEAARLAPFLWDMVWTMPLR